MNISVDELEEGLKELMRRPERIHDLAVVIHMLLEDMTSHTSNLNQTIAAIFNNNQN